MKPYKLGIIGCGGMAIGHHLGTIAREDVPFTAVAGFDIDPKRLDNAREKGLKAYDDLDAFFKGDDYDLILIATANNYHCEMACRAMEAGFNVMVEKPVARNVAEVETMIATSEKTGKLFTVHQNRRWDPDFMVIKKAIAEGAVGKPWLIESRIHSKNGNGDMYGWRGMSDHGGGMLLDWGVHMLDQVLWMIDEPIETVSAHVRSFWSEEVDDYASVRINFASGLSAVVEVATYTPIPLPRWMVYGDQGAMKLDELAYKKATVRRFDKDSLTRMPVDGFEDYKVIKRDQSRHKIEEFVETEAPAEMPQGGWHSLYQNLGGVLAGTEELIVKPAQVLRCMKVIEAAFRSSREGITVKF